MSTGERTRVSKLVARRWQWIALLGVLAGAVLWAASKQSGPAAHPIGERWGVEDLHIRRSAEGYLLDFRYRIVDSKLATSLLKRDSTVYVLHEKSGVKLPVPSTAKAGPLRNTGVPKVGRTYFALFTNPAGMVQRGDRVSVVLGDMNAELTVE